MPLPNLDEEENARFTDEKVKTLVEKPNADYAFVNSLGAAIITGVLTLIVVFAGIYSGWNAVTLSIVITFLAVLMVIIFLLIAIF